ncbi:uncharacterized protein V6R79_003015 [Siganus canaliculatus]
MFELLDRTCRCLSLVLTHGVHIRRFILRYEQLSDFNLLTAAAKSGTETRSARAAPQQLLAGSSPAPRAGAAPRRLLAGSSCRSSSSPAPRRLLVQEQLLAGSSPAPRRLLVQEQLLAGFSASRRKEAKDSDRVQTFVFLLTVKNTKN